MVHLLVCELSRFQNAWCNVKNYILPNSLFTDHSLGHLQQHYTMAGKT